MEKNIIKQKSFEFAVRIVKLYQYMIQKNKEYELSRQILRSGTSIGANVEEALGAISKADFRNKFSISYKEARETQYWLRLLHATDYINSKSFDSIYSDCDEICKILFSIIRTSKANQ